MKLSQFEFPFSRSGPRVRLFTRCISGMIRGIVTIMAGLSACQSGNVSKMETFTLGDLPLMSSALIYIAEHQGYFSENGLVITLVPYGSGVATMDALPEGKADLANMTEFVLVRKALQK